MSVRANRAKGVRPFEEVLATARDKRPAAAPMRPQWLRLAVLMPRRWNSSACAFGTWPTARATG